MFNVIKRFFSKHILNVHPTFQISSTFFEPRYMKANKLYIKLLIMTVSLYTVGL